MTHTSSERAGEAGRTRNGILRDQWSLLLDKDDRTSPEEYPDHCLITMEEVGDIIDASLEASVLRYREVLEDVRMFLASVAAYDDHNGNAEDAADTRRHIAAIDAALAAKDGR